MRLLAALAIALSAGPAGAERAIVVDAHGVPFAARDLADAIRVRVPRDGAALRVRVTAVEGGVRVETRGGTRDVELESLQGADAARLVALAATDLMLDDLASPPEPAPRRELTLAVTGTAAVWSQALGGASIDVALPVAGGLFAIEAGGGDVLGGNVTLVASVVRLDAGYRLGWLELRAGATVMPLFVTTGAGDTTVLVGGGASARVRPTIVPGVRAVVAAGADAFATRTRYELNGMAALATPAWAPWLALGVEVVL
ncbi:MAG: hypothetical protein ACM31C_26810 [Acidobacteriota bacterium]